MGRFSEEYDQPIKQAIKFRFDELFEIFQIGGHSEPARTLAWESPYISGICRGLPHHLSGLVRNDPFCESAR